MVITAIGSSGCNNSISYIVKNSNNPAGALFTPGNTTNFCAPGTPINFAISSWALNTSDTSYLVNYGDGSSRTYTQAELESSPYYNASNPVASQNFPIPHSYTSANCPSGSMVTLTITNSCNNTNSSVGPIIVLDKPTVRFSSPSIACVNSSVFFSNNTAAGFTNNCSTEGVYTWDFGDGTPKSNAVSPSHAYSSPGNYTITLDAVTSCGVGVRYSKTICVEPVLLPNFTFGNACVNSNTPITNTTDTRDACGPQLYEWSVISYYDPYCKNINGSWFFTAGTGSNSKNPVINYSLPGNYTLRLITENSCGIRNSISKIIEVKKPPTISLDPISNFCNSATINPIGKIVEYCGPSSDLSYSWSFPGGSPSSYTSLNPGPINYTTSGNYTATFSVITSCGTVTRSQTFL